MAFDVVKIRSAGRRTAFNHYEKSRCRFAADAAPLNYRHKLRLQTVILGFKPFEGIGDNFNGSKCGKAQRVAEGRVMVIRADASPQSVIPEKASAFAGITYKRWVSR
jgi:hypothetical protein